MLQTIRYSLGFVMLNVVGLQALEDLLSARGYHLVTHDWTESIQDRLFPGRADGDTPAAPSTVAEERTLGTERQRDRLHHRQLK